MLAEDQQNMSDFLNGIFEQNIKYCCRAEVINHVFCLHCILKSDRNPSLNIAPHWLLTDSVLIHSTTKRYMVPDAVKINAVSVTNEMHNLPRNRPFVPTTERNVGLNCTFEIRRSPQCFFKWSNHCWETIPTNWKQNSNQAARNATREQSRNFTYQIYWSGEQKKLLNVFRFRFVISSSNSSQPLRMGSTSVCE